MQPVPQGLLKEFVQSQHFTSVAEIMAVMKKMLWDDIRIIMEVEMDEELGWECLGVFREKPDKVYWAATSSAYPCAEPAAGEAA